MPKIQEKVVITVNEGQIRGIKEISAYSETPYYAFYGIPYAEPPVKNLRFKDPVKVKNWTQIYDGTTEKQGCTQMDILTGPESKFWGTEDCLYNNIFTKKLPSQDEPLSFRPVIVNIHGGSYLTGAAHTKHYGSPTFVMQHDIVYICISYRLHILGFMNLELKECSGNQGLKDIIMALHWIKDNVASFGGDPENITLLGCSSGAATINSLMLSPALDRSLFHKAVLMDGYLLNPVAPHKEVNKHHASELAKILGYTGDAEDYSTILKFLKRKDPMQLLQCLLVYQTNLPKKTAPITAMGVFSPSLDPEILPCSPVKLIESIMRIPIMAGFSEREAVLGFTRGMMRKETEDNFKTTFCQNCWGWGYDLKQKDINYIEQQMQSFYTKGKPIAQASFSLKVDIQSDICMSDFYDTLVDVIADDLPSSVFIYKFDFEGKLYTVKDGGDFEERLAGTYHGSEYSYWNCFHNIIPNDKETRQMIDLFTKMVVNFSKTGDPNNEDSEVQWRSSTPQNPCHLIINNPTRMVQGRLNEERLNFWDSVKKHFKKTPIT